MPTDQETPTTPEPSNTTVGLAREGAALRRIRYALRELQSAQDAVDRALRALSRLCHIGKVYSNGFAVREKIHDYWYRVEALTYPERRGAPPAFDEEPDEQQEARFLRSAAAPQRLVVEEHVSAFIIVARVPGGFVYHGEPIDEPTMKVLNDALRRGHSRREAPQTIVVEMG